MRLFRCLSCFRPSVRLCEVGGQRCATSRHDASPSARASTRCTHSTPCSSDSWRGLVLHTTLSRDREQPKHLRVSLCSSVTNRAKPSIFVQLLFRRQKTRNNFVENTPIWTLMLTVDLVETLGLDIVPYIVLLVVPVMGRMSDQDPSVRLLSTHCFASLIRLMPLEVSLVFDIMHSSESVRGKCK